MRQLIYYNLILMFNYYINVYLFSNKTPVFLVYNSMYKIYYREYDLIIDHLMHSWATSQ